MFGGLPLTLNLLLFAVGAGAIWWAGTRLERLTDVIARRTGLGGAFAGLILLAAATSLPEVATTVTALLAGNVDLAVHNLLGGVAFQVVVLTIADVARRGALTRWAPSFGLLMLGVGILLMLGIAIGGLVLADAAQLLVPIGPVTVGLNPVVLALPVAYVGVLRMTRRAEARPGWRPVDAPSTEDTSESERRDHRSGIRLGVVFAGFALLVLAGGWTSATLADVMAEQTGLSSGFVGATLLAAATSLPEVSTTVAAVRHGREDVAVSNVFGSNCFDVALLVLPSLLAADAFPGGTVTSAVFTAALGSVLTCVYLWGLLERSNRSVGRLGIDSIIVVVLYFCGMWALYGLG